MDLAQKFREGYEWPELGQQTERKGKFDYLTWSKAVAQLKTRYPEARWELDYFNGESGLLPFLKTEHGCFVRVALYLFPDDAGQAWTHPILNYKNKPIANPDAFDVNTSIERCLTKAIAVCTGIGLPLWAGEDLPDIGNAGGKIDDIENRIALFKQEAFKEIQRAKSVQALKAACNFRYAEAKEADILDEIGPWLKELHEQKLTDLGGEK